MSLGNGPRLYALNDRGIQFVVIAKTNMKIYATACRRSQRALIQQRVESCSHGHGSQAWMEELVSRVQCVTNLPDWDTYRPPKQPGKRLPRTQRPTLNAVVVRQWRNQVAATGPRVYLTNMSVSDPWLVVDAYDDRSWIENGLFRHHKQFCHLTRWFPQKTEGGVRSHLVLVMLIFAVATAYRLWDKCQTLLNQPQPEPPAPSPVSYHTIDPTTGEVDDLPPRPASATHLASCLAGDTDAETEPPLAHSLLAGQGIARWQRDLTRQQRDQVIVFCGNRYGIFNLNELLVLLGVSVQHLPPQLGSPTDILRRYDCWPNSP